MDEVLKLFGVFLAIGGAGSVVYLVVAVGNALVKRLEGREERPSGPMMAELAHLRARLDEADATRDRVADLEERLDFAERMLAQHRDAPRIGSGER